MTKKFNFSIINLIFTVCIALFLIVLCLESNSTFNKFIKTLEKTLHSNLVNHKIKYHDNKPNYKPYSITNSSNFQGYEQKPKKNIKNILNTSEIPNYDPEIEKEIKINPLFQGYYAQLGIFGSKQSAEEVIKVLSLKGILQSKFTTYMEEKMMRERKVYMLEIGVFEEKYDVVEFCTKLSKINIGCVLVEEY